MHIKRLILVVPFVFFVFFCSKSDPLSHKSETSQNSSSNQTSLTNGDSNWLSNDSTPTKPNYDNYTFVSPTVSPGGGDGTLNNPHTLDYIIENSTEVNAGDTIVLREGFYNGNYIFNFTGTQDNPVVITSILQEKVVIESAPNSTTPALIIQGSHTVVSSLTIRSRNEARNSVLEDVHGASGVDIFGNNIKLVNSIIYDNISGGIGFWSSAIDSEVYGCIIFNNGFQGPNRGHGHGIYTQNSAGTKVISNNIIFNTFGQGIQVYSEQGLIEGFLIEENILFNCGILSQTLERGVLVGGFQPADRIEIVGNIFYQNAPVYARAALQLGYSSQNFNADVRNNYIAGGSPALSVFTAWESIVFNQNTFVNYSNNISVHESSDFSVYEFNSNRYYQGLLAGNSFDYWQSEYGNDLSGNFYDYLPTSNEVFIFANKYDSTRCHVAVYNWQELLVVEVDLDEIFKPGDFITVKDVQNITGSPVFQGEYTGNISLPMDLNQVQVPFGNVDYIPNNTAPIFSVFLIRKQNI